MVDQTDELFTSLGFCQTYRRAFRMLGSNFCAFCCLFLCILVPMIVVMVTAGLMYRNTNAETGETKNFGAFSAALAVEWILYMLFDMVAKGSMIRVVAESYVGNSPSGWSCIQKTFARFGTLLCFNIVVFLVGFVSAIFPAGLWSLYLTTDSVVWLIFAIVVSVMCALWLIYFSVSIVCAMPAIMVERDLSAIASMKRAHSLSVGYFWYVLGIMILLFVVTFVVVVIAGPLAQLVNIVLIPLYAVLSTVIYFNLRVAKEDMTRETLLRELGMEHVVEVPMAVPVHHHSSTKVVSNQDNELI